MGVAGDNNFMTHEDQLLVAVEAGRVVGSARVSIGLAGGRRHLYARSGGVGAAPSVMSV